MKRNFSLGCRLLSQRAKRDLRITSIFHRHPNCNIVERRCQLSTQVEADGVNTLIRDILRSPVGSLGTLYGYTTIDIALRDIIQHDESGKQSIEVLDRLVKEKEHSQSEAISSPALYSLLYTATKKWRNLYINTTDKSSVALKPFDLVQKIKSWNHCSDLQADTPIYTMVLEAAASNAKDPVQGVELAESLLEWMIHEARNNQHFAVQPSIVSVGIVMKAWVASGRDDACIRIEDWLARAHSLHEEGWPHLEPNVILYNILLHALATAKNTRRAEQVLQSMLQSANGVKPDQVSFSTVLLAYTIQNEPKAMADAEILLNQMIELYESGIDKVKPNVVSFSTVMNGFAKLGQPEKAERLLQKLEWLFNKTLDPDWEPDTAAYNTVMVAWSNVGQPDRANAILQDILAKSIVEPNERSFHAVLAGWAKIGHAEKAEELLHQMHHSYAIGANKNPPTVMTYNMVLDAWAKSRRKDAWQRACDILYHMEDLYKAGDDGVQPNIQTWNTVFNCFQYCGKRDFHQSFKLLDALFRAVDAGYVDGRPNIRTWNTLLAGCVRNTKDDYRVQQIWKLMESSHCKPDIITYNTIFSCYSKYENRQDILHGMKHFLAIMRKTKDLVPTTATFLAIIDAWISFGRVEMAEGVLNDLYKASAVSNNWEAGREPFHRVLLAWSRRNEPRRVESLVLWMEELHDRDGVENVKPTVVTYNILLQAWACSKERQAGERADLILREMASRSVTPTLESYNVALMAWANSGDAIAPAKIESLILEMILHGKAELTPDHTSYNTWVEAIIMGEEGTKQRRIKDLLKTMKIHNFVPSDCILEKLHLLGDAGMKLFSSATQP